MFLSSEELSRSCRWMGVESTESSNYIDFKGGNFWWRKTYLMVHDAWPCVHNMTFAAQYHFSCKVPDESSRVVSNSSWLFFRYVPIEMNLLQLKRNSKYAKNKTRIKRQWTCSPVKRRRKLISFGAHDTCDTTLSCSLLRLEKLLRFSRALKNSHWHP